MAPETSKAQESNPNPRSGNSFAVLEDQEPPVKSTEEGEISPKNLPPQTNKVEDTNVDTEAYNPIQEAPQQYFAMDGGTEEEGTEEEDLDPSKSA